MLTAQSIVEAEFWQQPLADRMAQFAILREESPFLPVTIPVLGNGEEAEFFAVTRYNEVVEISRRPLDFCSGKGSTSIFDLPIEAMEFFGSFITMDDPRHARQRGIVARSFTPRQLAGVLESVERICTEVIDGICEMGEVDLVQAVSQPFPLLIICDMMGIPRSEFGTVLKATNVILGGGDPDMVGTSNPDEVLGALLGAGMELAGLMTELAEDRRRQPADDLTTALVHNDLGEDMLAPHELAPFFILLAVAGNDTTRTAISHGMNLLALNPVERAKWQADIEQATPRAVEEIIRARLAGDIHAPHPDPEPDAVGPRLRGRRQGRDVLRGSQPGSPGLRRPGDVRHRPGSQPARGFRRPGSALLPRRPPGPARVVGRVPPAADPPARHRGRRRAGSPAGPRGTARRRNQTPDRALYSHRAGRSLMTPKEVSDEPLTPTIRQATAVIPEPTRGPLRRRLE